MKGVDTPVLLALLHDAPSAKDLLKSLRGEEVATTELNLFELRALAARGLPAERGRREIALARLRRRITVLPVTAEAVAAAGRFLRAEGRATDYQALVWGTVAAAGCAEWITTRAFAPPKGRLPLKVKVI